MQIEIWPLDRVIPYARNPRKNAPAVEKVAASLREFGWKQPLVVDRQGVLVVGHTRVLAAKKLGFTEAPVVVASDLTPTQIKAYRLADNRTNEEAEWDHALLSLELEDLKLDGFDLALTAFDADELDAFDALLQATAEGQTDPDEAPEAPAAPVSVPGDLWILGNHRVLCGDATSVDAVQRLMDGEKADFCFTSPPYNAARGKGHKTDRLGGNGFYGDGYSDNLGAAEYVQFNADIFHTMEVVGSENFICCYNINYNKNYPSEYIDVVFRAKQVMPLVETIIWEKQMAVSLQGNNLTRIVEFIFVFCKGTFKINKQVTECLRNLWKISNIGANHDIHKACFPVALVEEGITYFAPVTGLVFEPFGGSGTTLIACEKTGRRARLMELDPRYVDVIVKRWQAFTGQPARHEDGTLFHDRVATPVAA